MRILVNAAGINSGGGETVLLSQLIALRERADVHLTVIGFGRVAEELDGLGDLVVERPPVRHLVPRLLWEHIVLARRAGRFDVLYCAGNFALPLARAPQVVAAHNALHFGADARGLRRTRPLRERVRLYIESALARLSVRRAFAVLPVSQSLRAAIEADLGPRPNLHVVRPATPVLSSPDRAGTSDPYVLSVAHDHPHKDWDSLVSFFAQRTDLPRLIVIGQFSSARMREVRALAPPDRVQLLGVVSDRVQLARYYREASCCVVHSRLESFGLTALEALAIGVPVIASDLPAHREVCRDAAAYYAPTDMNELAIRVHEAMMRPDDPERDKTSPLGGRTWAQNADELHAVLLEAVAHGDSTIERSRPMHDEAEN